MARSFTVGTLVTRAQRLADMENSSFVTPSEWRAYLSASYARLYNRLASAGLAPVESTQTITGTGVATYALPTDYFATIRIDYLDSGSRPIPLVKMSTRNEHEWDTGGTVSQACAYRIAKPYMKLLPKPSGGSYRHLYIPAAADLDEDSDTVDGIAGWEDYIVIEAAIAAKMKEESSTEALERKLALLEADLQELAPMQEWGEPSVITDAYAEEAFYEEGSFWPRRGVR